MYWLTGNWQFHNFGPWTWDRDARYNMCNHGFVHKICRHWIWLNIQAHIQYTLTLYFLLTVCLRSHKERVEGQACFSPPDSAHHAVSCSAQTSENYQWDSCCTRPWLWLVGGGQTQRGSCQDSQRGLFSVMWLTAGSIRCFWPAGVWLAGVELTAGSTRWRTTRWAMWLRE